MGRLYEGWYRVEFYFNWEGREVCELSQRMTYEEAEVLCTLFGQGLYHTYKNKQVPVIRAKVISNLVN